MYKLSINVNILLIKYLILYFIYMSHGVYYYELLLVLSVLFVCTWSCLWGPLLGHDYAPGDPLLVN